MTDALPYPEQKGWPRMWAKCIDHVRLEPGPQGAARATRIKRHWSLWFPSGTPNLLEKTISSNARMPFLEAYFQPAYFLYIRRNGYAVASGIRSKANLRRWSSPYASKGQYPIALCAHQWLVSEEFAERDGKVLNRFLTVSYEDLTEKPREIMQQITDFIGIASFPDTLASQAWVIHGKRSEIKNMNTSSFKRLSREDVRNIDRVAGHRLRMYGHERPVID